MDLSFAAINYRALHDRSWAENPQIDEQTLADTVEGLTSYQAGSAIIGPRTAIPRASRRAKRVRPSLPDAARGVRTALWPIHI